LRIRPTEVGGSFSSSLHAEAGCQSFANPTHGSGWIVQVQPTRGGRMPVGCESRPRKWVDRSGPAYTEAGCQSFANPTHGSGWIVQVQLTRRPDASRLRIPPTEVGGSFRSSLHGGRMPVVCESHPRKWVDRSGPAYTEAGCQSFANPTHGSGWIVQVQPTRRPDASRLRIPPTEVGGSFRSSLHGGRMPVVCESHPRKWVDRSGPAYTEAGCQSFANPTHGSGWIVQVQPTRRPDASRLRIPP